MVSKKKRPPTALNSSDVPVKKTKVEDAGTSNETEANSNKKKSTVRTREEERLPTEPIIKVEIEDVPDHDTSNGSLAFVDFAQWPEDDILELIKRMESNIPSKDNLRYSSRVEKLDWTQISFGVHSPDDCKETWIKIQERLRRFRLLKELIEDARVWVSKPWTHFYRSQKQNRHPDMPRRPLSTYMLFYLAKKDKYARKNPGLDMTAVSKFISKMYQRLPAEKKKKYTDMAASQRKEYDEKMDQFYQDHPEMLRKSTKQESKTPVSAGPKKPKPPFKLYFEDKLKRHSTDPDFVKSTFLEKCKEQWRGMSDKKKVIWINWALEEEARYVEELKAYKSENPEFEPGNIKTVLTKREKFLKERAAGKPEKPPNSGYSLFSRLMLGSRFIKNIAPKARMSEISRQWKALTDGQRRQYQEQANHMLDQYKLEYATYLESLPEDKRLEELSNNAPKSRRSPKAKAVPEVIENKIPMKAAPQVQTVCKTLFKGEPEQPPRNEFLCFLKCAAERSPKLTVKSASKVWQSMPDSEKATYRKKLEEMQAKYLKDNEKFLHSLSQDELKQYSALKERTRKDPLQSQHSAAQESGDEEEEDDDDSDDDDDDDDDGSKGEDSSSEDSDDDDNGSTKKDDNSNESGEDSDSDDSSSDSDSGDSACDSKNSGDSSSSTSE